MVEGNQATTEDDNAIDDVDDDVDAFVSSILDNNTFWYSLQLNILCFGILLIILCKTVK